jgi:ribosomal protein S18 acetylase RimI-like enzyme
MGRYQKNVRFEWNLAQVPKDLSALPPKHEIKIQLQPDTELTWEGIQRSFLNEKAWMIGLEAHLDQLRRRIFPEGKPLEKMDFFVLQHGSRVVGCSAVLALEGEGPQLLSGIVMDYEYQRRGLGVTLLQRCLLHLAEKGLENASVITREGVPAARYLYPKFGGRATELEPAPVPAT